MWRLAALLTKHLVITIPVMLVVGFLLGMVVDAAPLKVLILPLTFLMVYPMMVTLRIRKVFEGGDVKAQVLTQLINFAVVPFVAFGIGLVAFRDRPVMLLGLLLAALVPTSGMTISYTGLSRGNREAAVKMTVVGLVLGSLATPFYVKWLLGAEIEMDLRAVFKSIAIVVFLPMAAGFLTQQLLIKRVGQEAFQKKWGPRFGPLATFGVSGMVFVAMALKARTIAAQPELLLQILVPLAIFYAINYLLSTLVGRTFLERDDAIALLYGTVMRNLSIALAVAMNAFGQAGSEAALVVALAYVLQVQSAAWYVKYTDRVFGPKQEAAPA